MQNLFTVIAATVLVAGIAGGYRVLAWRFAEPLGGAGRALLLVPVMTLAVAIGVPFWWAGAKESFPWLLPPLASRMLAAAGLSFVVLSWLVLRHPSRARVRLLLVMVAVYLVPLLAALWAFHLDRLNFAELIAGGFLILADGLAVLILAFLWRQPTIIEDGDRDRRPSPPPVRAFLLCVAAVCGAWGLALFASDQGPVAAIWVWPGDPLSSRLIGVMLLALAAGGLVSHARADAAGVMLWTTLTYGLGLAAASLWQLVATKPLTPAYLVVFGALAATAALLLVRGSATMRSPPSVSP